MESTEIIGEPLPYATTFENLHKLIEAVKSKGDVIGAETIYSGSRYESVRDTLNRLGIISNNKLTELGKEYAYESSEEKRAVIVKKIILKYRPYSDFLEYQNSTREKFSKPTEVEVILNYWGKHDFGLSSNNRSDACATFCNLLEAANLGEYKLGRRGAKTRFEWNDTANTMFAEEISKEDRKDDLFSVEKEPLESGQEVGKPQEGAKKEDNGTADDYGRSRSRISPLVSITVDMSDWDDKKIKMFFKALNGDFKDGE